jgi:hypothetical protein
MHIFGFYPWECLTCQKQFFSSTRYVRSSRHPGGEVYTDTTSTPVVNPGGKERLPH